MLGWKKGGIKLAECYIMLWRMDEMGGAEETAFEAADEEASRREVTSVRLSPVLLFPPSLLPGLTLSFPVLAVGSDSLQPVCTESLARLGGESAAQECLLQCFCSGDALLEAREEGCWSLFVTLCRRRRLLDILGAEFWADDGERKDGHVITSVPTQEPGSTEPGFPRVPTDCAFVSRATSCYE